MRRMLLGVPMLLVLVAGCSEPAAGTPDRSARKALAGGSAAPSPTPKNQLTVVAAGDLLVHPPLTAQAATDARAAGKRGHDFTKVLAAVRPIVSKADLAICHLETPLAEPSGPFTGYPIFSVPPQLADAAAWAGFDTCSTASNHSLDTGLPGIARTLENLDRVGLRHTGTARTPHEAAQPTILDVSGVQVAQLSYTFSFNGIPRPRGKAWVANLIDRDAILAEARRARDQGAEIVILSLQWGTEYQNEPDVGQLGLARELLASPDLDLIIGHHVHVVQPFEKIGNKWVAYGLGNLTTRFPDGSPEKTQDSVVPRFTFTRTGSGRWEVTSVEVLATWMEYRPAARVIDLAAAIADEELPAARRANYQRIKQRITRYVDMRGARAAGLRMLS
ncbi:MAG TPA: CapA family protein [Micromonosporaceae bacterium]|nr:CapA family protein [Micromonosporaceae bacterium]